MSEDIHTIIAIFVSVVVIYGGIILCSWYLAKRSDTDSVTEPDETTRPRRRRRGSLLPPS